MARATDLSSELWAIIDRKVNAAIPQREIVIAEVSRRDTANMLIWVKEYGELSIPLVGLINGFEYYDLSDTGDTLRFDPAWRKIKRYLLDIFTTNPELPSVGDRVVLLVPWGVERFPMCVGVLQSKKYWREDL